MSGIKSPWLIASLALCPALMSCAHPDIRLASFISPDRGPRSARLPAGYEIADRVLSRGDQSIGVTYAHNPKSRAVILFCGGDAFHRSVEGAEALQALAWDADVALFDYPGYGDTSGNPDTRTILDTAAAVYDYIFNLEAARGKTRVLYGFSMGGMVAAQLARVRAADGLVLESTAPDVARWARSRTPLALRPFVRFSIEPQLARIDVPEALQHFPGHLLLLTSRADRMVPASLMFELEHDLKQAGRQVALIEFPGRAHGKIDRSPAFPAVLRDFLEELAVPRGVSP